MATLPQACSRPSSDKATTWTAPQATWRITYGKSIFVNNVASCYGLSVEDTYSRGFKLIPNPEEI